MGGHGGAGVPASPTWSGAGRAGKVPLKVLLLGFKLRRARRAIRGVSPGPGAMVDSPGARGAVPFSSAPWGPGLLFRRPGGSGPFPRRARGLYTEDVPVCPAVWPRNEVIVRVAELNGGSRDKGP